MKKIKNFYINLSYIAVIMFFTTMITGCFKRIMVIPAIMFLIFYIVIDRKYLRCPNCNAFLNLRTLSYAKDHKYHCYKCGKKIEIEK